MIAGGLKGFTNSLKVHVLGQDPGTSVVGAGRTTEWWLVVTGGAAGSSSTSASCLLLCPGWCTCFR